MTDPTTDPDATTAFVPTTEVMVEPSEGMEDLCRTCGQTRSWHIKQGGAIRHPFNDPAAPLGAGETFGNKAPDGSRMAPTKDAPVTVVEAPWPFDPVLRQALIDKGVIAPEDLTKAEATIRAVTANYVAAQAS
jgi:hypothetical protein